MKATQQSWSCWPQTSHHGCTAKLGMHSWQPIFPYQTHPRSKFMRTPPASLDCKKLEKGAVRWTCTNMRGPTSLLADGN
eukprot:3002646-Amphidinium_carterae.1